MRLLALFSAHRAGSTGLIFALAAPLMVLLIGGGIDLSREASLRAALTDSVDAAAIGAISRNAPAFAAATGMTGDGPIPAGADDAHRIFTANIPATVPMNVDTFVADVHKQSNGVVADVTSTASTPSLVLGIIGIPVLTAAAHSRSAVNLPAYIDYYMLLDNTPSMGIGATDADLTNLASHNGGCAFACHDLSDPNSAYVIAKHYGVTTRIDVLRSATQQLFSTAQADEVLPGQFRMGAYTFGASATAPGFTPVFPPTADLSAGAAASSAIDLMTSPYQGYNNDQDTDYFNAFAGANATIPNAGDGSSASSPQKVLFFVTDGVNDSYHNGRRWIQPIDPTLCTAIKQRGIKIAILYTVYLPLVGVYYNQFYVDNVAPINDPTNDPDNSPIGRALQACASPGLNFQVSPTQGISTAMNALFQKTVLEAHIIH